jgi:predicted component of type VI protein secretion system
VYTSVPADFYLGHGKFFRGRLLTSTPDQIVKQIDQMEQEASNVRSEILKLCWYMRGGLTYTEAMQLSFKERELISSLIKENLDTTKKSGLPFF